MKRRLFIILTGISLLLSMATVALWVRSYWCSDGIERESIQPIRYGRDYFQHGVLTGRGGIMFYAHQGTFGMPPELVAEKFSLAKPKWTFGGLPAPIYPAPAVSNSSFWNLLEFYYESVSWSHSGNIDASTSLTLPMWAVAVATMIVPCMWIIQIAIRRQRNRHGICPICDYDLRASKDRCPECGKPIITDAKT